MRFGVELQALIVQTTKIVHSEAILNNILQEFNPEIVFAGFDICSITFTVVPPSLVVLGLLDPCLGRRLQLYSNQQLCSFFLPNATLY
ncbi:SYNE2: Nesprin-2 [Crotalus adamanteus]|uniref:SYNE2: Nesprin-2 n=1 Tax=Crotalus adamanteus TaxID=8729 RepID=A0AAW1C5H0_CROAD